MLSIVLTLFLFPFVLVGWGKFLLFIFLPKKSFGFWQTAALGLPTLAFVVNLLNFFSPIYNAVSDIAWLIGLISAFTLGKKELLFLLKDKWLLYPSLILALALTVFTRVEQHLYDSGVYMHTIGWFKSDRTMVGAVLLDTQLGINSAWLSVCAVAWNSLTGIGGAFALNSVLVLVFLLTLVELCGGLKSIWDQKSFSAFQSLIVLALIFFLFPADWGGGSRIIFDTLGSPSTDAPAIFYGLLAVFVILKAHWEASSSEEPLFLATAFAVFGISAKMTSAFALLVPLIWLIVDRPRIPIRKILNTSAFSVLFLIVFLTKGFMNSGCLFFPMMCFSTDWGVSADFLQILRNAVKAYARAFAAPTDDVINSWSWFREWFVRLLKNPLFKSLAGMTVLGTLFLVFSNWFRRKGFTIAKKLALIAESDSSEIADRRLTTLEGALVGLCLLGIGIWFYSNPEFRYSYWYWLVLAFVLFSRGLFRTRLIVILKKNALLLLLIGAISFIFNKRMESTLRFWSDEPLREFPNFPKIELVETTNRHGQKYYYPKERDRCWNSPTPCLSNKNDNFYLDKTGFWPRVYTRE